MSQKNSIRTNYDAFMDIMSVELLAMLLAENRCTNVCGWCSEMRPYKPGNTSCDLECRKHMLEFLRSEHSLEDFQRGLQVAYIPKEASDE